MKDLYNREKKIFITTLILCIIIGFIDGYPIHKKDIRDNPEQPTEKSFPNGTVVGKYLYKDNDGNPVHVKYYADGSGYGVELKSVKIFSSISPESVLSPEKTDAKYIVNPVKELDSKSTTYNPVYSYDKPASTDIIETLVKDLKTNENRHKTNPDYDIFMENELKAPKKCGQDKVHVYYEKNKRKTRNTLNDFDALKYCEQMFS